jgi:hypothetical protein
MTPNPGGDYSWRDNNCQDWADRVLAEYERLRLEETKRTGVDPERAFVLNSLLNDE